MDYTKKAEIEFEAREAERQRDARLDFDPIASNDKWWLWRVNMVISSLKLKLGDTILDVGAASCEISEYLANLGYDVVALDISQSMLLISDKRVKKFKRKLKLQYTVGDSEDLPFKNCVFSKIICLDTLHHLPQPQKAVNEFYRILKPGGKILCYEPNSCNPIRKIRELTWKEKNLEMSFLPWKLKRLFKKYGFKVNQVKFDSSPIPFPPWLRPNTTDVKWYHKLYVFIARNRFTQRFFGGILLVAEK